MAQQLKFVNFSSPLEFSKTEEAVVIKGFASVSAIDRDREIVPSPMEFDFKTFMSSPTLLMDHKFLKDEFGNDQVAGVVTLAVPAFVKSIEDDVIQVHSMEDDSFVDTIDKNIAPNLKVGDKGLFVHAEVRHPVAIEKVIGGEMGGFSWRGIVKSRHDTICEDGEVCRQMKSIDLIEISIVHHPAQPQSTFMMAKSVDGEVELTQAELGSLSAYGIRFLKSLYPSAAVVKEYLKARNLTSVSLEEDDLSFIAYTATPSCFECSKTLSISMGGVDFLAAPEKEQDDLIGVHVGQLITKPVKEEISMADTKKRLFFLDEQGLLTRFPGLLTQSMKSIVTKDGEEIEVYTLEIPEVEAVVEVPEVQAVEIPVAEVPVQAVAPVETPEVVAPAANSDIEALTAQVASLTALVTAQATPEVPAVETPEVVAVEPELSDVEQIKKQLEDYSKLFVDAQDENEKLKNVLRALTTKYNEMTPTHVTRDEQIIAKSAPQPEVTAEAGIGQFISRTFNQLS